ncbi:hypothetical protein BH18CHL2_BH18CHL2_13440 [soil metagenome]
MAEKTVDAYVAAAKDWRGAVMKQLDAVVRTAAPKATRSIKWAQPVYEENGPFAFMKASASHVTLGFWRGAELSDPKGLLEGAGNRMKHVKIRGPDDVRKTQLSAWVKEATKLNAAKGDPTKRQ